MKTTGIFTTHAYDIAHKQWNQPLTIAPLGDIHWGAPHCASEMFKRDLAEIIADKNTYILGMGDYFDLYSSSERDIIRGKMHDSTKQTWEDMVLEKADQFVKLLEPARDRIIGLIEGNHYAELGSGFTTTQWMAQKLRTKYLGVMSLVKLRVNVYTTSMPLTICAHHGTGASRLLGGSINSVARLAETADADVYLMGHDHKQLAGRSARLTLVDNGKKGLLVRDREIINVRTGSYLRGYVEGKPSYIADIAGSPSTLGSTRIHITPRRETVDKLENRYLTYKVEI